MSVASQIPWLRQRDSKHKDVLTQQITVKLHGSPLTLRLLVADWPSISSQGPTLPAQPFCGTEELLKAEECQWAGDWKYGGQTVRGQGASHIA